MKTFRKLCKRFEKLWENYEIWFDEQESYPGYYRVCITDKHILQLPAYYTFTSCRDFREWMDGVVLD
jgi:hypothetical protein